MAKRRTRTKFGVSTTKAGILKRQAKDYYTGETLTFASELEKQFYDQVIVTGMLDGSIKDYKLQVKYKLQDAFKYHGKTIRPIYYISDFDIYYADGKFEVIDTKGRPTADAKIKAKLFKYKYPDIDFRWIAHDKSTGWIEYDELQAIKRKRKK